MMRMVIAAAAPGTGVLVLLIGIMAGAEAPPSPAPQGEVVLGMSTALTGPASQLGVNMRDGVLAAMEEANREGGAQGHPLRLVALDDGYEPSRTAPNMRELIDEAGVLAVVGNVGTPTAVAAIPIAVAGKTAFVGAYTGAAILRKNPPDRYVINYRASYAEETAAMVGGLVSHAGIGVEEIGFFTQRDAYGDAGFAGGLEALKQLGLQSELHVAHGRYERNTDAVENGLADLIGAHIPVRAVIMVGAYEPCALFIRLVREYDLDWLLLNVSFVGSEPLASELGAAGEGVIITQVVPHYEAELPLVTRYRASLSALPSAPGPSFGSLEGYAACAMLLRALEHAPLPFTREGLVDALENLGSFDIGLGETLTLGPEHHQACHRVWPTVIRGGRVVPFSWNELKPTGREAGKHD
jgi:branched-chain amino acid transport system substrate-binding protein